MIWYGRGEFDSEIKSRPDGNYAAREDVEPILNKIELLKETIAAKKKPFPKYDTDYVEGCTDGYNEAIVDILLLLSDIH